MEDSSLQLTQSEIENKSVEVNCGEDDAHHREPSPNSSKDSGIGELGTSDSATAESHIGKSSEVL